LNEVQLVRQIKVEVDVHFGIFGKSVPNATKRPVSSSGENTKLELLPGKSLNRWMLFSEGNFICIPTSKKKNAQNLLPSKQKIFFQTKISKEQASWRTLLSQIMHQMVR
jgi:hypothetical protein